MENISEEGKGTISGQAVGMTVGGKLGKTEKKAADRIILFFQKYHCFQWRNFQSEEELEKKFSCRFLEEEKEGAGVLSFR